MLRLRLSTYSFHLSTVLLTALLCSCSETFQYGLETQESDSCITIKSESSTKTLFIYGYMGKIDGSVTPVFNAIPAETDEFSNVNYKGDRHWDLSASEYRFYAYTEGDEPMEYGRTESRETLTFKGLELKKTLDHPTLYTDLGTYTPEESLDTPVNLKFKTPYALLEIVLEKNDNTEIVVENVHFGPVINYMCSKADVVVTHHRSFTDVKVVKETAEMISYLDYGDYRISGNHTQLTSLNVLPQGNQGRYKLMATINGQQFTAFVPSSAMAWEPSVVYTYVFSVSENSILFKYMDDNAREI